MGGGGARSDLWCRIQAEVYGQRVETLASDEGAAYGAALLAGVGIGVWETVDEACAKTIRVAKSFKPDRTNVEIMNRRFEEYRKLYPRLRNVRA